MAWVLQSSVTVSLLPRDQWVYRPIPTSPNADIYALSVRPAEDVGANVNAAGFYSVVRGGPFGFLAGRSWIIHFQSPRNEGFFQSLEVNPPQAIGGYEAQWFVAVSLPKWFPPTDLGVWKWTG